MGEGGISARRLHAPSWLRLEGLFSAALLVPWQGVPAILDAPQKVDEKRLARLCVALARANALLTAWQALAIALVEPELREALGDSEEIAKLDVVLGNGPALAAWFEQPVRSAAATELRAMLDNAVVLPAVQSESVAQWFDKPIARLASIAAEHLALQLEAAGMRALPFVLGVPSSPAFRELAAQSSAQLRRLWASLADASTRQLAPSLADRWTRDLYLEARYVGRVRSDMVARGDVSESRVRSADSARGSTEDVSLRDTVRPGRPKVTDDVQDTIAERAIDEEWSTLADLRASIDDAARIEPPPSEPAIALITPRSVPAREQPAQERHRSGHVGLVIFAAVVVVTGAIALFMALAGRGDGDLAPSATGEPLAVVAPVTTVSESPAPAPTASAGVTAALVDPREVQQESAEIGLAAPPLSSATAAPVPSTAMTPTPISRPCDLALIYVYRGEIAQAIRRFENCLPSERDFARQAIGKRSAADVRAKAEKGQCDEAAAIVAQVESIEAAGAAKAAFASLCASRAGAIENETAGP